MCLDALLHVCSYSLVADVLVQASCSNCLTMNLDPGWFSPGDDSLMCVVSHAAASPNADPLQIWLVCFLLLIFPLPLLKSLLLLLLALTRGSLSLPLASRVDAASVNAAAIVAARVSPARAPQWPKRT